MVKILNVAQMVEVEKATDAAGVSYAEMMQRAGRGVAEVVKGLMPELTGDYRIAVLVGPGNNGGDGLVAATILKAETEATVGCYLFRPRAEDDDVFVAARDSGVFLAVAEDDQRWRVLKNLVGNADIVIDALLGTGTRLPIRDDLKKLLTHAASALEGRREEAGAEGVLWPASRDAERPDLPAVVAVDCPSGLDCDSGELASVAIPADMTVTFAAAKYGQLIFPGAGAVGELVVVDIGTPPGLEELAAVTIELLTAADVKRFLPVRQVSAHKGTYGRAMIVAGSVNYTGAAALAAQAAYRVGAGLVTLAVPQAIFSVLASQLVEPTWLLLPHDMGVINTAAFEVFQNESGEYDALLIGPGIGRDDETAGFLHGMLEGSRHVKKGAIGFLDQPERDSGAADPAHLAGPLIVDADGLNLLAEFDRWWELLPPNTILTPHLGEMARLTGLETAAVTASRFELAEEKAREWDCVVVLKGAFTVVAAPDGRVAVMPFATDALATAGTGDVLAGCIAGLLAQRVAPFEAAAAGAYTHGLAGRLAGRRMTPRSTIAGDVLKSLPIALQRIDQGN